MKKKFLLSVLFFTCFQTVICTESSDKKRVLVYSHGFGEPNGKGYGPTYPDAPAKFGEAVFYTKPAVHTLADYLKDKVDARHNAIDIEGRSCGAGIAINTLYHLIHYDETYFEGSSIASQEDAQKVVAAIQNGSLDFTVPFLSLKKAKAVSVASDIAGKTTLAGLCLYGGMKSGLFDEWKGVGVVAVGGLLAHRFAGKIFKASYASSIDHGVHYATGRHYDPSHIKPLDALVHLKGKIKCPVLLHQCMNDGVLVNPDADTVKLYDAMRHENETQSHIVLSNDEGWHNYPSWQHEVIRNLFRRKYSIQEPDGGICAASDTDSLDGTQPDLTDLRKTLGL